MVEKKHIRKEIFEKRKNLTQEQAEKDSREIYQKIITLPQFQEATCVYALSLIHIQMCIRDSSSTFQKGLTVTTFYLAKGLEFDQVFAICRTEKTTLLTQAEYICATRALHELYMYTLE